MVLKRMLSSAPRVSICGLTMRWSWLYFSRVFMMCDVSVMSLQPLGPQWGNMSLSLWHRQRMDPLQIQAHVEDVMKRSTKLVGKCFDCPSMYCIYWNKGFSWCWGHRCIHTLYIKKRKKFHISTSFAAIRASTYLGKLSTWFRKLLIFKVRHQCWTTPL